MRRLTVTLDPVLERAISEARERLDVGTEASDSEKLRAYARAGYERTLETELDAARLATYRAWADAEEMSEVARAASRRAAARGLYEDS